MRKNNWHSHTSWRLCGGSIQLKTIGVVSRVSSSRRCQAFAHPPSCLRPPLITPHMFAPQLPLEVTNMVIDHLHDTNDDTNRRTLEACSLVCRGWVSESRFHLFRKVWLSPTRVHSFLELLVQPRCTIPLRFVRHLHMRPIDRRAWREDASLETLLTWAAPSVGSLESALARLTKLTLHFVHWGKLGNTTRDVLLTSFQGVTFLDLVVHRFHSSTSLTCVLRSFPALRDLELGYLEREYAPVPSGEGALPAGLRSLKLKGTPEAFVDELARGGPFSALRTLKLIERNASRFTPRKLGAIARFLAVIGSSLQTLELRARHVPHHLPPSMPPGERGLLCARWSVVWTDRSWRRYLCGSAGAWRKYRASPAVGAGTR